MGSEHDPETENCAPSEYKDGKYLMYPWAVSGYDNNNKVSLTQIHSLSPEYRLYPWAVSGYDNNNKVNKTQSHF